MLKKINNVFDNFIYSYAYPFISIFLGAIFFILGIQTINFIAVIAFGCILIATKKNLLPVLPMIFSFIISIREASALANITFSLCLFVPLVIAFIIHFIRFHNDLSFGTLFIPFTLVSITYFLGGLNSETAIYNSDGFFAFCVISPVSFALYVLMNNSLNLDNKTDTRLYFTFVLLACGLAVSLEVIAFISGNYLSIINDGFVSPWEIGWLNTNVGAYILLLAIPTTLYLMLESKFLLPWYLLLIGFLTVLFIAESDGAFGVSLILSPFALILLYTRLKTNKKTIFKIYILISALILFTVICLYIFNEKINTFVNKNIFSGAKNFKEYFDKHFLDDTGRSKIFKETLPLFQNNIWFGGGYGAVVHLTTLKTHFVHSTPLHVLFCSGIVGLLTFIVYYVVRIRIYCKNNSDFNFTMFFGFILYECYAMVDAGEFILAIVFLTMQTLIVEKINKGNYIEELPLNTKLNI